MKRICVFCGSGSGLSPEYAAAAVRVGRLLASQKIGLVYGGGNVGLMGAVADAALSAGGVVIGVIPTALAGRELAHHGVTDLRIVGTMHERKALMAELSDGFIALPGGMGTLEETAEILTWAQLGLHAKPCAVLNVLGYWDGLLAFLDHAVSQRFLKPKHRALVLAGSDPEELLARMRSFRAPDSDRWIRPGEV